MDKHSQNALAKNLRALMKGSQYDTQVKLGKKTGVSQKTISNMLNPEHGVSPTLDKIDEIAGVWGLAGWELLIPDLSVDVLNEHEIPNLVKNYASATTESRTYINRVAEKESTYNAKSREQNKE